MYSSSDNMKKPKQFYSRGTEDNHKPKRNPYLLACSQLRFVHVKYTKKDPVFSVNRSSSLNRDVLFLVVLKGAATLTEFDLVQGQHFLAFRTRHGWINFIETTFFHRGVFSIHMVQEYSTKIHVIGAHFASEK